MAKLKLGRYIFGLVGDLPDDRLWDAESNVYRRGTPAAEVVDALNRLNIALRDSGDQLTNELARLTVQNAVHVYVYHCLVVEAISLRTFAQTWNDVFAQGGTTHALVDTIRSILPEVNEADVIANEDADEPNTE